MRKFYLLLCIWVSGVGMAVAQQEATLATMRSLHQANYLNPAVEPQQKFYLGLPGISSIALGAGSNSLNYEVIEGGMEDADSLVLDVPYLRAVLKEKNYLSQFADIDVLSMGFRLNARVYVNFRTTLKSYNRMMITPGVLDLYEDLYDNMNETNVGLADFTIAPDFESMTYLENVFGASYKVNRKLSVGANLKFLRGFANVHTENLSLSIQSDPNSEIFSATGDLLAYTSGDLEDLEDPESIELAYAQNILKQNKGMAFDLGATYQLNNRLSFGASLLNIGGISWKNEAKEFKVNNAAFTYESLDPDNMEADEADAFVDSLEENFIPKEKLVGSYRTSLPKKVYLTASYYLQHNAYATGMFFFEAYDGRLAPGFTAAVSKDFGRRLGASLSYTAVNNTYANVGAGLSFRLTPFQLYVVSDNVMAAFNYKNAQHVNLRAGLNLVIGTLKKPAKLPQASN